MVDTTTITGILPYSNNLEDTRTAITTILTAPTVDIIIEAEVEDITAEEAHTEAAEEEAEVEEEVEAEEDMEMIPELLTTKDPNIVIDLMRNLPTLVDQGSPDINRPLFVPIVK